jgi:predicted nucleotidyltransferase
MRSRITIMALPVQSIRAKPEHRELLQRVAEALRSGFDPTLREWLDHLDARPVGPFRSEAVAIAFLRDRLVAALKPRAIWLFGSRARGDAHEESDFDLLVVLPDGLPDAAYDYQSVAEPVVACGLGYDIVPCALSDFLRDRAQPGSLVHRAVTEGRPIYLDRSLRKQERIEA